MITSGEMKKSKESIMCTREVRYLDFFTKKFIIYSNI